MEYVDHADFIEVTGELFLTKRGQQSLMVRCWRLLSKALLPLPEKWHGLSDVEIRYRKRYLDLLANPEVFDVFRKRSLIVQKIREVLTREGFMEVETPILQTIAGGAAAKPFVTHHNALDMDLYLRIAPELFLKRLIVGGYEKVFEVARCFRNEGVSFQHNPEFTQVEFYWAYANYEDLMSLTERMLSEIVSAVTGGRTTIERDGITLDFKPEGGIPRRKFFDLVQEVTGIDLSQTTSETELRSQIQARKPGLDISAAVGYGELCDLLYKEYVRPGIIQPTFVIDYPAAMIPLAKRKAAPEADRIATVQLVVQGMEVTKAYNELNDPLEQQARFVEEEMKKGKGSEEAMATDADFIEALKHGMPPTAGFGMGIDRLTAVLTGAHSVKEVILFPTMRPEANSPEHD
jgi:lysyl-tRNA synthetase class 2